MRIVEEEADESMYFPKLIYELNNERKNKLNYYK